LTVAWGAFDTVIAVLCLGSLYFLNKAKVLECAVILGVAVALKPIALPLSLIILLFPPNMRIRIRFLHLAIFVLTLTLCYFGPFIISAWKIPLAPNEWNYQTQMAGGMTLFNISQLFLQQDTLPQTLSFLGYLWIPALLIATYAIHRNPPRNFTELIQTAILLLLVFFLSRSWISEPNVNLLIPLMLVAVSLGILKPANFHLSWIIPLVFMFPNYSFPQLFFLVDPSITTALQLFNSQYGTLRLVSQILVALCWQVFALMIIRKLFRTKRNANATMKSDYEYLGRNQT
jgi:hypothetical protein